MRNNAKTHNSCYFQGPYSFLETKFPDFSLAFSIDNLHVFRLQPAGRSGARKVKRRSGVKRVKPKRRQQCGELFPPYNHYQLDGTFIQWSLVIANQAKLQFLPPFRSEDSA